MLKIRDQRFEGSEMQLARTPIRCQCVQVTTYRLHARQLAPRSTFYWNTETAVRSLVKC
jgi:hypothetical protein